jgi:hypothetical protein
LKWENIDHNTSTSQWKSQKSNPTISKITWTRNANSEIEQPIMWILTQNSKRTRKLSISSEWVQQTNQWFETIEW